MLACMAHWWQKNYMSDRTSAYLFYEEIKAGCSEIQRCTSSLNLWPAHLRRGSPTIWAVLWFTAHWLPTRAATILRL